MAYFDFDESPVEIMVVSYPIKYHNCNDILIE